MIPDICVDQDIYNRHDFIRFSYGCHFCHPKSSELFNLIMVLSVRFMFTICQWRVYSSMFRVVYADFSLVFSGVPFLHTVNMERQMRQK